ERAGFDAPRFPRSHNPRNVRRADRAGVPRKPAIRCRSGHSGEQPLVGCVHAKWLPTNAKVGSAKDDMEKMRSKLPPQIGKLLLAFWVKEPGRENGVNRWLQELADASGTRAAWTETFNALSAGSGTVADIPAGVTLYEVV